MSVPENKKTVRNHRISGYSFSYQDFLKFFLLLLLVFTGACRRQKEKAYLFSYFKGNGENGLHLAYSLDGLQWTSLNKDESFLRPQIGSRLMRDPSICRGPDGIFHMVWTTGWWDNGIGVAHSKDLINFSGQTFVPVMADEPNAKNCWAPEIFYDGKSKQYLIFWATTIEGLFSETQDSGDNNHRIYAVTTRDFEQYSETQLFYEPGFNVIDSFIARDGKQYVMFLKDETRLPVAQKNIHLAFSDKASGPYSPASDSITGDYWAEGPSAVKIDGRWIVYFDKYTERQYGAVSSENLEDWQDISDTIEFPPGARHGTVFVVDKDFVDNLIMNTESGNKQDE